jgi:putative addiction module component (TIGR02574 family)
MNIDLPNIFAAALTLPDSERANLAFQLLNSLTVPGIASEQDLQLQGELERRLADYDSGITTTSSIDDVSERIRSVLASRKSS